MNTTRKMIVTALACAGIALGAGPAMAYKGDCGPMGYGGPMMGEGGPKAERMQERMAARQEQLHKDLKLTPAQEPAWKTFTEKSGPKADWKRPDPEAMNKLTAPERMEKMMEFSKQHQAAMGERLEAMKTFYAVLTPEQKKVFDEHHAGPRSGKGRR